MHTFHEITSTTRNKIGTTHHHTTTTLNPTAIAHLGQEELDGVFPSSWGHHPLEIRPKNHMYHNHRRLSSFDNSDNNSNHTDSFKIRTVNARVLLHRPLIPKIWFRHDTRVISGRSFNYNVTFSTNVGSSQIQRWVGHVRWGLRPQSWRRNQK